MAENIFSLALLSDLGWPVEVFTVVAITLIGRFVAMRFLKVMARHLEKTTNAWGDAVFDAACVP